LAHVLAVAGFHIVQGGQISDQQISVSATASRIDSSDEPGSPQSPAADNVDESWSTTDMSNINAFLRAVRKARVRKVSLLSHKTGVATTGSELEQQESLFVTLYPFVKKGLSIARPYIITAARRGLAKVDSFLAKQQERPRQEAALTLDKPPLTDFQAAEHIIVRAVVAECALQVVLEQNPSTLENVVVFGCSSSHFFDCLLQAVQKLGPVVEGVVSPVLKMMAPLVVGAINGDLYIGIYKEPVPDYRAG